MPFRFRRFRFLVEVIKVLSLEIVDIPVPRGRGKRRVHGFLPEQSSTAQPVEQLVDIPSSRRGLYGSLPEQGTTAQTVEQIVDIPSGGVCGPGSSSAAAAADEDFTGVFRTFPHGKKVRSAGQVSADLPRHVSSSTPAAQPVSWWASLTPAQRAELEQARAEVRREHVSKRKRKKRRKKKLPRAPRPRQGRRRPCDHLQQVPKVHVVRESGGAPVPVLRQCGGHSCFVSMDFQTFSSGKYSWTCVSTAPVAELTVMSFTVPWIGSTIVATANIVTSYSSSADCPLSAALCAAGVFASRCRVVVDFSLLMVLTILFGTV